MNVMKKLSEVHPPFHTRKTKLANWNDIWYLPIILAAVEAPIIAERLGAINDILLSTYS